ncbi:MAG TPA: glycosyltransferase [Rubrobacteraceae bacterium]|nr:glycosyltransferase [Rubrobacteraceae bacterium]
MDRPPVAILSGIRWDFLWQRHQILASRFARAGYPTVFVETTGLANPRPSAATLRRIVSRLRHARSGQNNREKGLTVYAPLAAPPTGGAFRRLNRAFFMPRVVRDLQKISGPEPIVVAYPPTRTTLDLISNLRPRLVLYDCSDDYAHFPGAPKDIAATERELLLRADLVSCTSTRLLERVRPVRPDAFLSGPAVDYERFAGLQDTGPTRTVRTVCFFGHLSEERTDFDALRAIAGAGFVVRLVGGLGRVGRGFLRAPGVDYRGEVPHEALPTALAGVDAFLLPYRVNPLTQGISPAKTYECLATGRPVVATPLPAIRELAEHVYLAQGPGEFVEVLRNLEYLDTPQKARARVDLARENSWEVRFAQIEAAIRYAL